MFLLSHTSKMHLKLATLLFSLAIVSAEKISSNFKKCNRNDPDLNKCLLKAVELNIPQLTHSFPRYKLPSLVPLEVPALSIAGKGSVAVDQHFKNCKFYGFNKILFSDFNFDFSNKQLKFKGIIPHLEKKCEYEVNGKIMMLPIKGNGNSSVIMDDLSVDGFLTYKEVKKQEKTYFNFKTIKILLEVGHMSFNFEKLFGGDERMSDAINKVLNDNWKQLFEDVKTEYVEVFETIIKSLINNFFSKVSLEEALD